MKTPITVNKINCARKTTAPSWGVKGCRSGCSPDALASLSGHGSDMQASMRFRRPNGKYKLHLNLRFGRFPEFSILEANQRVGHGEDEWEILPTNLQCSERSQP
jgi:hypothetical protein